MLLSHILVYAPSAHSRSALISKTWLEITQDFVGMLYKHSYSFLYQLMVNHDGVFRLHRTNTNLFQITERRLLSCSLTHNLVFHY